ncbi:Transcription-repair coupling factor [[Synechococcus] sp. NIES-970]|uniref:transcription-repair coupling factor n=1 Tax=Picosynechococcus sp. NKBG15041c TaxID=1407650 RepID=UPI00040663EB|nr:transcription-repair coupling factor [Picosynechococcus sp. NKBG15041c]BAW96554.1 Transcription-repair coupling factor [[Synechococcus] sp. NIES-970]
MTFSSVVRFLSRSVLMAEFQQKLCTKGELHLSGIPRLPKGLIASGLAQLQEKNLLVVCATLEEAGRWAAQLEAMGWGQVLFYPTSEASPYEAFDPESEMIWGQMQTLGAIAQTTVTSKGMAIVATERALQPHLPPQAVFQDFCLSLTPGQEIDSQAIADQLTRLGYERVSLVEVEGQWTRRGDIVDVFPVSGELPVRLDFFGDELESIREFDPTSQRSLDKLEQLFLTPTTWGPLIGQNIADPQALSLTPEEIEQWTAGLYPEGMQRFLGVAFGEQVASILDYLPENTLVAVDELAQCLAHGDRTYETHEGQWQLRHGECALPKIHRTAQDNFDRLGQRYPKFYLTELDEAGENSLNLSSRPVPITPHQFGKLAEILRGKREIYSTITLDRYSTWLVSAQPSRSVALLQEHDCAAQFIPNPRDYPAIEKHQIQGTAIALKYKGQAELEGFILPTFRLAVVTDREFYGQHALTSFGYIRKRRRAASKAVDVNKLNPGDYIVHKSHGIGRFIKIETLQSREYLVLKYEDGTLRIPADSLDTLSRYRHTAKGRPELHKMGGKTWEKTKEKVRKSVKKLAVDLLKIYAQRTEIKGIAYPTDTPWQQEMEDSFPYQATPDQLKAVQDIKRDLEGDRPMDRLVCGDVGFGKTEVAIRAIFKVVTSGHKQVALLAPTTILTQQHYHTLKERFAPYPINIGLLNRFRTASERKDILERLKNGELDIVIGTQQILGQEVVFKDLGMLVVDEEQRFGVNQKEKIKAMKTKVDVLTLSATPIPRTLYMSLSGIREMSLITTPPPSRRPIQTHVSRYNPEIVRTAIRNELDRGGQIFYVVPRVEGIEEIAAQLQAMIPTARVAIAHGQMDEAELETTMLTFNNGEADILLCTTIVESGLDIPRVNTIIVEDAQRFGLSQLYQLRGRVGRSGIQAHAWLLYPSKGELTEKARKRLRALQEFSQLGSGYQLAMRDMEIRGVGNLLGAEQSGQMEAIGFELYMEMLQECINEIRGEEIPQVDDCQIDLKLTAFIPANYIPDPDQKLAAYRLITRANSRPELVQIAADWGDRYGQLPPSVEQLLQVIELKAIAKSLGFSRIKPEGKQNIALETPMEEPAWKRLEEKLPTHLHSRFVYTPKKVTVRGLGAIKPQQQLDSLIEWLGWMQGVLEEAKV